MKEVKKVQKAIVEAQEVAKQYFNAMVTDIEAQKQLDKLLNTIPIAKEYLKKTSNEMIAPLFHEVQLQIEQIHAIVTKVEDVLEKAQEAFHIAKVFTNISYGCLLCKDLSLLLHNNM